MPIGAPVGTAFLDIKPEIGAGFQSTISGALGPLMGPIGLAAGGLLAGGLAAGFGLFKVGETFDEAFDQIRIQTGQTGDALDGLKEDFKQVFASVPTDAATAGEAIAGISQRLDVSGEALQGLSEQFLTLSRITGTDLEGNITSISRVFKDWDVSAVDEGSDFMDQLFRASQATGIGVDALASSMTQFGGPLRQLGFNFETSAALIGKFEKEGVNSELVLGSLRIALGKMAKAGEPVEETLARVTEEIANAGSASEANALALELFGARAGPDMAAAIREGRFEVGDLVTTITEGSETIMGAAEDTDGWRESLELLKNKTMVALEPVATKVFGAIGTAIEAATPFISTVVTWLSENLPRAFEAVQRVVGPVFATIGGFFSNLSGTVTSSGVTGIVEGIGTAFEKVAGVIRTAVEVVSGIVGPIFETIVGAFQANRDRIAGIAETIGNIFSGLGDIIRSIFEGIKTFWAQWGDEIMAVIGTVVDTVVGIIGGIVKVLQGIIDFIAGIFTGDWKRAWGGIKDIFGGIWDTIKSVVTGAFNAIMAFFGEWIGKAAAKIGEGIDNIKEFFRKLPGQILDFLKELPGKMLQFGKDLVSGILEGLGNLASSVFEKIKSSISNAIDNVLGFFGIGSPSKVMAAEVGKPLAQGILKGYEDALSGKELLATTREAVGAITAAAFPTMTLPALAGAAGVGGAMDGGSLQPAPTTVTLFIDPEGKERLAEFVIDWQTRRIRQVTRAGITVRPG